VVRDTNLDRDVDGAHRGSFRWNDADDRISLPIDVNPVSLPQVTLCAWVHPKSLAEELTVLSNDDGGGDRKIFTPKKGKERIWAISDGKGGFIGEVPVQRRRWVFVAARYDEARGTASIFVDGKTTTGKAKVDMGSDQLFVGANKRKGSDAEALIDEVYVYDRLLSDAELEAIRRLKSPPAPEVAAAPVWFYQATQKLPVRARAEPGAAQVGLLSKGQRLEPGAFSPVAGKPGAEWLKVELAGGKSGFAQLKYLEKKSLESAEKEPPSALEAFLDENFKAHKLFFWGAIVLALLAGLVGGAFFPVIDRALGWLTGSDYQSFGWFPWASAFCGFLLAFVLVVAQDSVEYYLFENFTLWPDGYGFATWLTWIVAVLALVSLAGLLVESVVGGGLVHGPLRATVQAGLGVGSFVSSLILTAALIVLAVIVAVGLLMLAVAAATLRDAGREKVVIIHR
jgi:hypothetical protein